MPKVSRNNKRWGFDTKNMDEKVRPQDDFYDYVNGGWIKTHTVPADESRWGSFIILRHQTEKQLRKLLQQLLSKRKLLQGSSEQMIRDFYNAAIDMKSRNKRGITPIQNELDRITKITNRDELLPLIAYLHRIGLHAFWGVGVDQDSKQSEKYILHLYQSGLGMPDRDYYLSKEPEPTRVREAYTEHIKKIFILFGVPKKEACTYVKTVLAMETRLAKASMNKIDVRDPDKTYHKKDITGLAGHAPQISWKSYIKLIGAKKVRHVIVMQPDFIAEVNTVFKKVSLPDIKLYLLWTLMNGSASLLGQRFVQENFNFYARVLMGSKKMKPLWRRALASVNGNFGELFGQLYVKKYFGKEAKRRMNKLVDDLFSAFEARLKKLDWMSPLTKNKALIKLKAMRRKIGYPNKWKSYRGLAIYSDDHFGNALRIAEFEHKRALAKLKKPVDRTEWHMSPQTVNAYFNPGLNEIVFPAAILQAPFFDPRADDAVNYGAIGYTIGHEITHSFDDQGSKFDEKGNLKSWWSKKDRLRFERKTKRLVQEFNGYEVAGGLKVNGKLTLGENIADLGGVSIAFDAYQMHLKKTGRKNINGFTPEQRFFLGMAQGEREIERPEFIKTIVMTDPHSPSKFRVNGPMSNLSEFYQAFKVKKGHKLYREPNQRAKIW